MQPPGWYPDPGNTSMSRWWDGQQWTGQTRPLAPATPPQSRADFEFGHPPTPVPPPTAQLLDTPAATPAGQFTVSSPSPPQQRTWYTSRRVLAALTVAVVSLAAVVIGFSGGWEFLRPANQVHSGDGFTIDIDDDWTTTTETFNLPAGVASSWTAWRDEANDPIAQVSVVADAAAARGAPALAQELQTRLAAQGIQSAALATSTPRPGEMLAWFPAFSNDENATIAVFTTSSKVVYFVYHPSVPSSVRDSLQGD